MIQTESVTKQKNIVTYVLQTLQRNYKHMYIVEVGIDYFFNLD